MKAKDPQTIVLLSDSTGDLGERMIRAFTTQFPKDAFSFRVFSFIQKKEELKKVLHEISSLNPILFHTTLVVDLKRDIEAFANKRKLPVYDLTGGAMEFLEKSSKLESSPHPALLHELNQEYESRIRSLDFTVGHDDGLNLETIRQADIVLLGVSRTSKTPTSIYLAYKGYKVANVPLVKGLPLPEELLKHHIRKIVGLTIEADKLREIRLKRAEEDRNPGHGYTDRNTIEKELEWAYSLFMEWGCPVVDVTHHAVEETAALVLKALCLR